MAGTEPMPPLRVLALATLFPDVARPNFGLFVAHSLGALARQPGVELTVIAPVGLPLWPLAHHPRYRALTALPAHEVWQGLSVHRPRFALVPVIGARLNPAAIARAVLPLARRLHQARPFDVIDAEFFYPDGPAAMRIAAALGLPFSAKARGADISHFGHAPGTADQVRAAGAAAAGLLAVSAALRDDMAAIGINPAKVRVHYTGIDHARFLPPTGAAGRTAARAALRDIAGFPAGDGPIIATIGALIPRKGQELVIRALPALPGVHYVLAGDGPGAGSYLRLAAELGVADRVHLLGPVAQARLPDLYRAANAVVMPSASEGLANAWVEALACGTPIVISAAGGAGELIRSDAAGRICAREPSAIAAAVAAILAAPPAPADVAASLAGRFDWNRNGAQLAAHLRGIAAPAPPDDGVD